MADEEAAAKRIAGLTKLFNAVIFGHRDLKSAADANRFLPALRAQENVDQRDEGAKNSKENAYEADMVLRCVRYIGQQGYSTADIVILTPYLGQLFLLMKTLEVENDPILNDLDSAEFIRAGLLPHDSSGVSRRKIRISTIGKLYFLSGPRFNVRALGTVLLS
jgi:hypothetical protein